MPNDLTSTKLKKYKFDRLYQYKILEDPFSIYCVCVEISRDYISFNPLNASVALI